MYLYIVGLTLRLLAVALGGTVVRGISIDFCIYTNIVNIL